MDTDDLSREAYIGILYIVGISCVGKTTIGKMLAENIGFSFFDLDIEIQNY
jgi:shikimate kinase